VKDTAQAGKGKPFRTVAEVADEFDVCEKTVRRWIRGGELRVYRIGRLLRIASADLDAFAKSRRN